MEPPPPRRLRQRLHSSGRLPRHRHSLPRQGSRPLGGNPVHRPNHLPGWHFLEMKGEAAVLPTCRTTPPRACSATAPPLKTDHESATPIPTPSPSYLPSRPGPACFRLSPKQPCYAPANVTDGHARPNHLPRLWISEPTDFRYPEFLELTGTAPRPSPA